MGGSLGAPRAQAVIRDCDLVGKVRQLFGCGTVELMGVGGIRVTESGRVKRIEQGWFGHSPSVS